MVRGRCFLWIVCWGFSNIAIAADFKNEAAGFLHFSSPLHMKEYIQTIDDLYWEEISNLVKPQSSIDRSPVLLRWKTVTIMENEMRRTSLRIIDPSAKLGPQCKLTKINENKAAQQDVGPVVGKIVLFENPQKLDQKGKFHLDLVYVYEKYQGEGIGTRALASLKKLARKLISKSSFYKRITLVAREAVYREKPLSIVPHRVKFFMDNGFYFYKKTETLTQFLCIKHFIDHFDEGKFADYLKTYVLSEHAHPYALIVAGAILPIIQASPKFQPIPFSTLLYYVQTNGSICSVHILDRAFYWGGPMTDERQKIYSKYVYAMHQNVTSKDEKIPDPFLRKDDVPAAEFLQEEIKWKNFPLLPDQNKLNEEIFKLMFDSNNYPKIDGKRLVQILQEAQQHPEKKMNRQIRRS